MSDAFSIKSVRSDAELAFTGGDGDYFTVELRGTGVSAVCRVWGYTDCQLLVELLGHLAGEMHGLTESSKWASIEGDLALTIRGDKLGHVFIQVEMKCLRGIEDWQLNREIQIELGQLPNLAKAAARFFQHGACG